MKIFLTVWDSTQTPHRAKTVMAQTLGLLEHQVRVIAPDVGGGFGPKAVFHPEEIAIPAAALLLRRPIKWIEDRLESFTATVQERRQIWDVEVAFDADGKLSGIRGRIYHDHGANVPYGVALPYNGITNMIGPYVLPALHLVASLCLTNMVPVAPTRGAGRPQGTFVMERILDRIAKTLNLTRDEVRRRNLIAPEKMPYATPIKQRDGSVMTYDSGDYPECQRRALKAADWDAFEARRAAARARGTASRHRTCQLCRRHRARTVRKRRHPHRCIRTDRGFDRRDGARPRHQDHAGAARRQRVRRLGRSRSRGRRRYRGDVVGSRCFRQPPGGDRRQCRLSRGAERRR